MQMIFLLQNALWLICTLTLLNSCLQLQMATRSVINAFPSYLLLENRIAQHSKKIYIAMVALF